MARVCSSFPLVCIMLFHWTADSPGAEVALPQGDARPSMVSRHFSDRVHEFVWRNWNAVEPAEMAKLLGASVQDVTAVAASMGLPPAAAIPPEMKTRGYITLIRRNWHLLPYEQLLELVGMTAGQLAFTLREDDALWIKLGMLKPMCEPLRYRPPDETARRRSAQIKRVVEEQFGEEIRRPAEPRFSFVEQLSRPTAAPPAPASPAPGDDHLLSLRFIYSYFALYGDPLWNPALDPFPDGLLQRLSGLGINGVWLHVVLRDLAPGGAAFPEFGTGHERRLANLRTLVERARKYGIGVYLYMNEPRGMPEAFFRNRPEMTGTRDALFGLTAMCTSNPTVRQWMGDALAHVFRQVPDLAGVFSITASENLTNCASRGNRRGCPRCKDRTDTDIIAEVNAVIEEGVHRGSPKARVIAWDWGWHGHGDAPDIIERLPKAVWLMSVSEWALPIDRGGVKSKIGEYSLSAVGPGPRATRHWKLAQEAGLKTAAKVQLNNTWELSSMPYLPVMDLVAEHCHNLASAGVNGMMLSWSLGGYPSPNLEIAARFRTRPTPGIGDVLDAVAVERYGPEGGPLARKAWTAFSTAFREFPYSCGLYSTPLQMGAANPLYATNTGFHATMVGIPYDDVASWRGAYPAAVFISQLEKVAGGWQSGIPLLKAAVDKAPPGRREEVAAELRFAEAARIHFQSVANQTRYVVARDALAKGSATLSPEERHRLRGESKRCLQSEIVLARRLFTLAREDSRVGFEASNHYFYLPLDMAEKVINCQWLLSTCENQKD
jgi:hypothetical protein